jgi:hypothetical protein
MRALLLPTQGWETNNVLKVFTHIRLLISHQPEKKAGFDRVFAKFQLWERKAKLILHL